jgi:ribosomal protein S18 acetylase RimI-like enzyme
MNPIRLTPQHAGTYRSLMLDAYKRHPDAFTSSVLERASLPLAWWEARLSEAAAPGEIVFGSFVDGELVGVAGLAFEHREKAKHKASLFGMYVRDSCRGMGLGGQLVDAAMTSARSRPGVLLVQLTVTEGNLAAQTLYQRKGFVPFGLEPYAVAVGSGFVAKVHMWCQVN